MNPLGMAAEQAIPSMRLLDADELAAAVLTQAGLKIEADDPAMTDMLIQQAVLAAVFTNFQTALAQQHEQATADFQTAFGESAASVLEAAQQIERKKQADSGRNSAGKRCRPRCRPSRAATQRFPAGCQTGAAASGRFYRQSEKPAAEGWNSAACCATADFRVGGLVGLVG